jgi:hypothetical protein
VHKVRRNKDGPFLFLKQQGINLTILSLIMCLQIISKRPYYYKKICCNYKECVLPTEPIMEVELENGELILV